MRPNTDRLCRRPRPQCLGVEPQVVLHEACNEVVGVVIALLHSQRHGDDPGRSRSLDEPLRRQLHRQERVGRALVHQEVSPRTLIRAQQLAGVIGLTALSAKQNAQQRKRTFQASLSSPR